MLLKSGDHVCALYSSEGELARVASEFLAKGLRASERCWYVPGSDESELIRGALETRGVDTTTAIATGALTIVSTGAAYRIRGVFDPEETMRVFNSAIEQALTDGFVGFRAAANMSWALTLEDGLERLITYEALLRSLFETASATGLCLYDRSRMPLDVIDGALCTHPVVLGDGTYRVNPFYDPEVRSLPSSDPAMVERKLAQLRPHALPESDAS